MIIYNNHNNNNNNGRIQRGGQGVRTPHEESQKYKVS